MTRTVVAASIIAAVAATMGAGWMSQPPKTDSATPVAPTPPTAPTAPSAPQFTINDVGFLAGSWQGDMDGAFVEENWSAPQGNNVVGSFRWLKKDGTPMMFEMLAITEEADAVRLRLRHYSAALKAKEAEDKPLTLRLARVEPGKVVFEAEKDAGDLDKVRYAVVDGTLKIDVVFKAGADGGRPEALNFRLKKSPAK